MELLLVMESELLATVLWDMELELAMELLLVMESELLATELLVMEWEWLVMEELLALASTSTLTRSPPTHTSTMLLMTTVGQTSKPRRLMMEQQPDRDPTPWLSLMEGSSTSTTMPMMLRDMSPRSSMMELLLFLLLLPSLWSDMVLSDTVLWDMVLLDTVLSVKQVHHQKNQTQDKKIHTANVRNTSKTEKRTTTLDKSTKRLYLFVNSIYEC